MTLWLWTASTSSITSPIRRLISSLWNLSLLVNHLDLRVRFLRSTEHTPCRDGRGPPEEPPRCNVADSDASKHAEPDPLSEYRIEPWGEDDLPLLQRLLGDPAMTEHLGGPESPEKIEERHGRYLGNHGQEPAQMFRVIQTATGESVGRSATGSTSRVRGRSGRPDGWCSPNFRGGGSRRKRRGR